MWYQCHRSHAKHHGSFHFSSYLILSSCRLRLWSCWLWRGVHPSCLCVSLSHWPFFPRRVMPRCQKGDRKQISQHHKAKLFTGNQPDRGSDPFSKNIDGKSSVCLKMSGSQEQRGFLSDAATQTTNLVLHRIPITNFWYVWGEIILGPTEPYPLIVFQQIQFQNISKYQELKSKC